MSSQSNTTSSPSGNNNNQSEAAFLVKSDSPKTAKDTIKMLLSFWFNLFA